MKNLTDILMLFARAKVPRDRTTALYYASQSNRFDDEQQRILRELHTEARNAENTPCRVLRPLVLATEEDRNLMPLQADGCPVLDDFIKAEVAEWIEGWNNESGLLVNQCQPPGALLLHGPTGSGKTTTARGLLAQMPGRSGVVVECHRMLESFLGKTGERLAKAFDVCARTNSLMLIEEIDALAIARNDGGKGEIAENNRITVALMRLIEGAPFPVVATTNRPTDLDVALLRRFEFKLELLPLPEDKRRDILRNELGSEPPAELVALPLNDSLPKIKRLKRARVLAKLRSLEMPAVAHGS